MRLTVIGSGDAFGSGGRFNTCFLIETGDRKYLLDCGATTPVALKTRGIDFHAIDAVILSHLHGDHFGGLPFLLIEAQLASRRDRALTVVGPPGTRERVAAALEVLFPLSSQAEWRFPLEIVEIEPGRTIKVLGLGLETAEVLHESGAPSTAVRLTDGHRILGYSGDTEWTEPLRAIAAGADLYITECYAHRRTVSGHLDWATLEQRLGDLRARQIMITHMNSDMLAHADEARAAGLLVAEDGTVIDL